MTMPTGWMACFTLSLALAACRFDLPELPPLIEDAPPDVVTGPVCGDAIFQPDSGEECDTAGNTKACNGNCTVPRCGDGYLNPSFTPPGATSPEACDTAGDSMSCDADCTAPVCGDGHVNVAAGEQCDDGNTSNSDYCTSGPGGTCRSARCGDGYVRTQGTNPEQCDGGGTDTASCDSDCTAPVCGDGYFNPQAETCDPSAVPTGCLAPQVCCCNCKCV